jgi:hypothetical protein
MPELSDKELKFGYWFLLHRETAKRALWIIIITAVAAVWIYSGWQWIDWLTSRKAEEAALQQMISSSVNIKDYIKRNAPVPLEIGTVTAVPAGKNVYNLIGQVKNPNIKWGAIAMSYTFTANGEQFSGEGFILPQEEKYLLSLGVNLKTPPQTVTLEVPEIKWKRVQDLSNLHVPQFSVLNQKLEQLSSLTEGGVPAARLKFDLVNNSAYSFWQMGVTVVLTNAGSPQAVGRQTLTNILSNGKYPVEFYWPQGIPYTDNLTVKTEVNLLDPAIFKPL